MSFSFVYVQNIYLDPTHSDYSFNDHYLSWTLWMSVFKCPWVYKPFHFLERGYSIVACSQLFEYEISMDLQCFFEMGDSIVHFVDTERYAALLCMLPEWRMSVEL